MRALWGLWVDRMNEGAVGDALRLAERFSLLASRSPDPIDLPIGKRTMGVAALSRQRARAGRAGKLSVGMAPLSYSRHRVPPPIIQHSIWLYLRFTLSYRGVEEMLVDRGLDVL